MAILLHWAIALLILANWPLGYFSESIERQLGTSPVALHKSLGLTILALSLVRLGWRLWRRPPAMPEAMPPWRKAAAQFTHAGLYLLIILVPLTGWLRTSAGKYPLTWFGIVDVPKFPIHPKSVEAALASTGHEWLAWSMLLLAAVHVAAALHHHLVLRDSTAGRMLPRRSAG